MVVVTMKINIPNECLRDINGRLALVKRKCYTYTYYVEELENTVDALIVRLGLDITETELYGYTDHGVVYKDWRTGAKVEIAVFYDKENNEAFIVATKVN